MNIDIRECNTFEDLAACVQLQRDVFALPEIEISPVRHLIVTKHAGGFSLGAFVDNKLIGFVLSVPAVLYGQSAYYSHMTAVLSEFQSYGIGAKLKWAQRERALSEGIKFIKWTFQPVQTRNAFFNLEKLGAIICHYEPNFYGTDYSTSHQKDGKLGIDSDRLFAEWHLESPKVIALAAKAEFVESDTIKEKIQIPDNWNELVKNNLEKAIAEQTRVKGEFQEAFAAGLIAKGFDRKNSQYLLY